MRNDKKLGEGVAQLIRNGRDASDRLVRPEHKAKK
jgi:hypothetical protein